MDTSNNLFAALSNEHVEALFTKAGAARIVAGRTLFLAGEPATGCYRVDQGLLKVSTLSEAGGERILAIVGPGALVGELAMLDDRPRSATVTAIRDSELSFVSRGEFRAFAEKNPQIYKHLSMLLARRLRDTNAAIATTSLLTLRGRIARALLDLSEAFGHDVGSGRILIRQKITQSDLAAMAGIARENLSRILKDWSRQSVISRLAGYYCLDNKSVLEREAKL
jgi:CRP/FNR family transcriptional regulator, cyclic AMP receptor protein